MINSLKFWILAHYFMVNQTVVFFKTLARVWSLFKIKTICPSLIEVKWPVHWKRKQKFQNESHADDTHVQFQNVPVIPNGIDT